MYVKIQASEKGNGNKGSSNNLVNYLMKENQEGKTNDLFFDHNHNSIAPEEVIKAIDSNKKKLGKDDAKFYSIVLSPSKKELKTIQEMSDKMGKNEALRRYTSAFMDEYALNFKRDNLNSGDDLVYFAKIERERKYAGTDPDVKWGNMKSGTLKEGDNSHIHIVVSRKDKTQKLKLSPLTHHKKTAKGPVKGGFVRTELFNSAEQTFDLMFDHSRAITETFKYHNETAKEDKVDKSYDLAKEVEHEAAAQYMDNFELMEEYRKVSVADILKEKAKRRDSVKSRLNQPIKKSQSKIIPPKKNRGFSM